MAHNYSKTLSFSDTGPLVVKVLQRSSNGIARAVQYSESITNWFLPPLCPACKQAEANTGLFCTTCETLLPLNTGACACCAVHIESGNLCGRCITKPPAFDRLTALWTYDPPVRDMIVRMKYSGEFALAKRLGMYAAKQLAGNSNALPEALIPMPMHNKRLAKRGYNQALLIAKGISRATGIQLLTDATSKVRDTTPQNELSLKERRTNLYRAFEARPASQYRHVAIVDDVATSCASVNALAQCLRSSGYEKIDVWCLARAQKPAN